MKLSARCVALRCFAARWSPVLLRFLLVLLVLPFALPVEAQPRFTGNFVPQSQYATSAALALFVDPTGNDNGTCLASGTSACATPAGAIARIPYRVRHAVTVTIAAGTYANLKIQNLSVETGGTLTFNGPSTNFAPATGTATGSLTAVSNTVNAAPTVTDSAQSWTTDNLRGRFLEMTNGTANNVRRVIVSNTATTITLASGYPTAPSVGNTYAIRTPGVVLNGTGLPLSVKSIGPGGGSATITAGNRIVISQIEANTANAVPCAIDSSASRVTFDRVRCVAQTNGFTGMSVSGNSAAPTLSNVYVQAANVAALVVSSSPLAFLNSTYARSSSSISGVASFGPAVDVSGSGLTVENTNVAGHVIDFAGTGTNFSLNGIAMGSASLNLICPSGSTGYGLYNPRPDPLLGFFEGNTLSVANLNSTNCREAAHIYGRSKLTVAGTTVTNVVYGFTVAAGGSIYFAGVAPAFSGVLAAEYRVDEVDFAVLSSGITNLTTLSSIIP